MDSVNGCHNGIATEGVSPMRFQHCIKISLDATTSRPVSTATALRDAKHNEQATEGIRHKRSSG
ncbi:uncharacterized protein EHS24_005430 [Apiotrichum porosum]|uniref:Uncharacterized protein n=1 Tax=Apiotrichum porosum TaxID=105984 RepID=A0A427XCY8_9TREE|nr:uncharacterized protein EHS24_005430 [Apiotrichum porosum]RSH76682.1 hypothetical protein EHS24_005430 [Apiotrichum porosum]